MSPATAMTRAPCPGHISRLLLHASWALAAVVFFTVGWLALAPWDPQGPVSVLTHDHWTVMVVEVLALAAVMSALATALAGRVYPDVGVFSVCAGVAAASLRGDTMSYLLINRDGGSLVPALLGDALFWCVVVVVAMCTSAWVARCFGYGATEADDGLSAAAQGDALLSRMAAPNIPVAGGSLFGGHPVERAQAMAGLKHLMLATGIAVLLISFLLTDGATPNRAIRHGQACFAVAIGVYVAVGRAQAAFPVGSTFWPCLSVPVVCLIAYGWSGLMSPPPGLPGALPSVPPSGFLRVLPVTYIMVGTCAALLAVWPSLHAASSGKRQGAPSPGAG